MTYILFLLVGPLNNSRMPTMCHYKQEGKGRFRAQLKPDTPSATHSSKPPFSASLILFSLLPSGNIHMALPVIIYHLRYSEKLKFWKDSLGLTFTRVPQEMVTCDPFILKQSYKSCHRVLEPLHTLLLQCNVQRFCSSIWRWHGKKERGKIKMPRSAIT